MRVIATSITALALFVVTIPSLADEPRPEYRLSYNGSPELPDHLAYRGYIGHVEHQLSNSQSIAEDFVIFSLRLPETEEGLVAARIAVDVFSKSEADIKRDVLDSQLKSVCDGAIAIDWSKDDYYRIMDLQDDLDDAIAKQHYLYALQQLDQETATLLHKELARQKLRMSLVRVNHKVVWETYRPDEDLVERFKNNCIVLTEQYETISGAEQ